MRMTALNHCYVLLSAAQALLHSGRVAFNLTLCTEGMSESMDGNNLFDDNDILRMFLWLNRAA